MPKIVNALLISDQKILLARRSVHRRAYPDCWSLPGGHVEDGESNEEALTREMMEEIGVIPTEYRLIAEIINPKDDADPVTFHIFTVGRWEGNPTIRDDEHTELRWFALRDAESLPDLALEEYRPLFAKLLANKS
jgi:8-oxo-dGTP diphosphatase